MSKAEYLETALKAAVSAGNLIEERHKDILNVSRKESLRDIVTHVDKLAENQIIDILKDYDKNIPILTEESGFIQGNLEKTCWIVEKHGLFQSYYYNHHYQEDRNLRDKYIDHQYYEATINFCHKWDQASFDPNYDTIPLEEFVPMVGRIFNRDPYKNL